MLKMTYVLVCSEIKHVKAISSLKVCVIPKDKKKLVENGRKYALTVPFSAIGEATYWGPIRATSPLL